MEERIYKEFLTDINKEIDRLTGIISGLLTLAKADSEAEALTMDNILLSALVYKVVAAAQAHREREGYTAYLHGDE